MGRRSGLHATAGPCVEGWFWASLSRMGLNKDGNLIGEDVLGFFRWSVLELSLFGCVFSGVWVSGLWVGGLELSLWKLTIWSVLLCGARSQLSLESVCEECV